MKISYERLFQLMKKRNIRKQDLRDQVGLSPATVAKLSKNENVSMDVIVRLCSFFDCKIEKIVEVREEE